jgi:hypothetical protein
LSSKSNGVAFRSEVSPTLGVAPDAGRVVDDELWGPGWRARRWVVLLPTTDPDLHIIAFANVHYKNGIVLTAPLVEGIPSELAAGSSGSEAKGTEECSSLIYSG